MLTHQSPISTQSVQSLARYAYALDQVGNRRTLTETLVAVYDLPAGAYLETGGLVVAKAETGQVVSDTTHTWQLKTTQPGYTGTAYLQAWLDTDALPKVSDGPGAEYAVNFTTPGTYTVWLRGYPTNAASDSAFVRLGQQNVAVSGFAPGRWAWANEQMADGQPATLSITTTGLYTLNLSMREDGLRIDRLLLTTDTTYFPTDLGPSESARVLAASPLRTQVDRTIAYNYDNLYRLTGAGYSTGESYAYSYDPVGNRLQQIINTLSGTGGDTTDYLYDSANRLEQVSQPSAVTYQFDANGNLLSTGMMTNTWDAANHLTQIVNRQLSIITMVWATGWGRRWKR